MADPEYKCSTARGYRESRVRDRKIELKDTTQLKNNVKSVCNTTYVKGSACAAKPDLCYVITIIIG